MARTLFIVVTDDTDIISKARSWGVQNNVTVNAYSSGQWSEGLNNPAFRTQIQTENVTLTGGKVYNFPSSAPGASSKNVQTMNQIESDAIINAIAQYKGNLTEAAKALGIGRATIYRKIKQYNIDPNGSRGKGSAAA